MPFINFPDNPSIGDYIYVGTYKYTWTGEAWDRELVNVYDLKANVKAQIVDGAPNTLDTLKELADALGNDADFAATITGMLASKVDAGDVATALSGKYDKSGGTITGTVTITGATEIQNDTLLKGTVTVTDPVQNQTTFSITPSGVEVLYPTKFSASNPMSTFFEVDTSNGTVTYLGSFLATVDQLDLKANTTLSLNPQTANYTVVSGDAGKVLTMDSTSARTYTIQTDTNAPMPVGTEIAFIRLNTGSVTVNPAAGVTLNSIDNKRAIKGRYGSAVALKLSANNWVLIGSLE
jgi:hypothetical protein